MTSMVNKGIHKQKPRPSVSQLVTRMPQASKRKQKSPPTINHGYSQQSPQKHHVVSPGQVVEFSPGNNLFGASGVRGNPIVTMQDLSRSESIPLRVRSPERVVQHRPHYMCLSRRSRGDSDDSYSSTPPQQKYRPIQGSTSRSPPPNVPQSGLRISVSPISNNGRANTSFTSSQLINAPTTGRYNIMYFYQQLIQQINKAEKTTVVCSHLLKQLNWCLQPSSEAQIGHLGEGGVINLNISSVTDRNAQTYAIKGFNDLLRAIQFAAEVDHQEQKLDDSADLMAPDQQAKCIIQYIKEIKNILGVSHLFSLSDLLSHNKETLIQHLVSIYSKIIQEDPRIGPSRNYNVTQEELQRLLSDLQPIFRASTPKLQGSKKIRTEVFSDIDSLEAKKQHKEQLEYIYQCEEKISQLKQMLDQQQLPHLNGGTPQNEVMLHKKVAQQQQEIQCYEGAVKQLTQKIKAQNQELNDMLVKTQIVEQYAESDKEAYYKEIETLREELQLAKNAKSPPVIKQPEIDTRQFTDKIASLEKLLQEKDDQIKQLNEKLRDKPQPSPKVNLPAPSAPQPRGQPRPPPPRAVNPPARLPAPPAPSKPMSLAEQLAAQATKLNKNEAPEEKKVGSVNPTPATSSPTPPPARPRGPPAPSARPSLPPAPIGARPPAPRPAPARPAPPVTAAGKPMSLAEQLAAQAQKLNQNEAPKQMSLAEQLAAQATKLNQNNAPEEKKVGQVVEKALETEQIDKLNAENKGLKDQIAALEQEAAAQKELIEKLKESEAAASKLSTSASEELSQLKALNQSMISEKETISLKHEESLKQLDKVKADLKQKSSEVMKAKLDAQAAAMQDKKKKEEEFKTQTTKISMIESNIKSLQNEKTAMQKQFEEKLKSMVDAKSQEKIQGDLEAARKQLRESQEASQANADKLEALQKDQGELTHKLAEKQKELDALKANQVDPQVIESLNADKSRLETENKTLVDKTQALEQEKVALNALVEKTSAELKAAMDSEAKVKEELDKATAVKGELEKQVEELKKQGEGVAEVQRNLDVAEKKVEELQDDLEEAEEQLENSQEDLAKAQEQLKDLNKQLGQIHELKTLAAKMEKDKQDAEACQKQAENMVHQLTFTNRQMTTKIDDQEEEIEKLKNELEHMKNASFVSKESAGNLLDISGDPRRWSEKEGGPPISTLLNDSRLAGLDKSVDKTPDQSMEMPHDEAPVEFKSFKEGMKQTVVMESPSNNASAAEESKKDEQPTGFMGAFLQSQKSQTAEQIKAQQAAEQAMIDNAEYDSEDDSDEESDEDSD